MVSPATNLINITVQIMHSHHYQAHDDTDLTTLPSHCKEMLNYYLHTTALRYLTTVLPLRVTTILIMKLYKATPI